MININTSIYQQNNKIKAADLPNRLLSQGISSITTEGIATLLSIPKNQIPKRMAPLKKRGEMILLAKNLWVAVPPEYISWGAPPAIDIIDALMRNYNVDYYVGWLYAAIYHGASHHATQVFQVAVSRSIREKMVGRSRILFYHRTHISSILTVNIQSRSGNVPISNKETTILDIAADISVVGGIDNATNLIIELCEASEISFDNLMKLSSLYNTSAIRRLGYLIEHFTDITDISELKTICDKRNNSISILDPESPSIGSIDKKWNLKINREVYPNI